MLPSCRPHLDTLTLNCCGRGARTELWWASVYSSIKMGMIVIPTFWGGREDQEDEAECQAERGKPGKGPRGRRMLGVVTE